MSEKPQSEVVRWYTLARRFPQLIGRTPDGTRLWGGPYTITQAIGAGVVLFVGANTMGLWARFGFFGNVAFGLVAVVGVIVLLGRIPVGSRSPLSVVTGALRATSAPTHGRLGGHPVKIRRPHRVRHSVAIARPRRPAPAPLAQPHPNPAPPAPNPVSAEPSVRQPALSGVQALLATRSETPR